MITDKELDALGEFFVDSNLINKNWEFHEFVQAYLAGYIVFTPPKTLTSKLVIKLSSLLKKVIK